MFQVGQWSSAPGSDAQIEDLDAVAQRVVLIDQPHHEHSAKADRRHHRRRAAEHERHHRKGSGKTASGEEALKRAAVQDFGVANYATVEAEHTIKQYGVDV